MEKFYQSKKVCIRKSFLVSAALLIFAGISWLLFNLNQSKIAYKIKAETAKYLPQPVVCRISNCYQPYDSTCLISCKGGLSNSCRTYLKPLRKIKDKKECQIYFDPFYGYGYIKDDLIPDYTSASSAAFIPTVTITLKPMVITPTSIRSLRMVDLQLSEEQKKQLKYGITYIFTDIIPYKVLHPENIIWIEPEKDVVDLRIADDLIINELAASFSNIKNPKLNNFFTVFINYLGEQEKVIYKQSYVRSTTFVGEPMIGYINNSNLEDLPDSLAQEIFQNGYDGGNNPNVSQIVCSQKKCFIYRYFLKEDNRYYLQYQIIDNDLLKNEANSTVVEFGLNLLYNPLSDLKRSEELHLYGMTLLPEANLPDGIQWRSPLTDMDLIKAEGISLSAYRIIGQGSSKLMAVFVTRNDLSFSWQLSFDNLPVSDNFMLVANISNPDDSLPNDGYLENNFSSTSPILACSDHQCLLFQYTKQGTDLVLRYAIFDYQE